MASSTASRPGIRRGRATTRMTRRLLQLLKKVPDILATIAATSGKPLELWFQDEARIGQKNKVTRRWAERGTRPFALKDQRTASAYIFGAISPGLGKAAGLVLPSCNTEAMTLHLQEIAVAVAPGAHAVLFVDRAGWHVTAKLGVPENITLVPLPSKSPELNPVENIWQYMRDNWLSNRIFANYNDILDHCCSSCRSERGGGPMGRTFRDLVLTVNVALSRAWAIVFESKRRPASKI